MKAKVNDDQRARFAEATRSVEADQSPDALDRVFGKLDLKRKSDADGSEKATDKPTDDG